MRKKSSSWKFNSKDKKQYDRALFIFCMRKVREGRWAERRKDKQMKDAEEKKETNGITLLEGKRTDRVGLYILR